MLPHDELIRIVASDLRFLESEWDETVDDDSLRRTSPVLRRLLVDNELQRAWKAAGFDREPQIEASTLSSILAHAPLEKILFASAGGARYGGAELRGAFVANCAMSPDEIRQRYEAGIPSEVAGLRSFIEAPCVVSNGRIIPRRVVVKFISNKLGGAHHDSKRGNSTEERMFSALDRTLGTAILLEKPAVYFELLSAGQALVASGDIKRFIEAVQT